MEVMVGLGVCDVDSKLLNNISRIHVYILACIRANRVESTFF